MLMYYEQTFMPYYMLQFVLQVKIQGQNQEMLLAAAEQFLGKRESEVQNIALETLEGHQRAIMGSMTVEVSEKKLPFLLYSLYKYCNN